MQNILRLNTFTYVRDIHFVSLTELVARLRDGYIKFVPVMAAMLCCQLRSVHPTQGDHQKRKRCIGNFAYKIIPCLTPSLPTHFGNRQKCNCRLGQSCSATNTRINARVVCLLAQVLSRPHNPSSNSTDPFLVFSRPPGWTLRGT